MPQVPYSNVPSQSLGGSQSLSLQSIQGVSADAFGAGIARAQGAAAETRERDLSAFARQLERTGDTVAKHVIQFQERENRATATDLYTQAVLEVGKLDAAVGLLEGKARADALPGYQKSILGIQQKFRDAAPNAHTAQLFDQDFKRRAAYSIVNESQKSAVAMKQYNNKAFAGRLQLADAEAAANANDDVRFAQAVQDKNAAIEGMKRENSWGPEETQAFKNKQLSELWQTRLVAMSVTNPMRARELYNKNKDSINDPDARVRTEHAINQGVLRVQSRVDADKIMKETDVYKVAVNAAKPDSFWGDPDAPGFEQERIATVTTRGGKTVKVNKAVSERFEGFLNELEELGYPLDVVQGYNNRNIFGTNYKSQHAFGNAIDINPSRNPVNGSNDLPPNISAIAAKWGLSWGGDWKGDKKDPMHFEASADEGDPTLRVSDSRLARAMEAAEKQAEKTFPDEPGLQAQYLDTLQTRIKSDFATLRSSITEQQRTIRNTINESLFSEAKPTSLEQMTPEAQEAYRRAPATVQALTRRQLVTNARVDVPYTDAAQAREMELRGLAIQNPEAFKSLDLAKEEILPRATKGSLQKLQLEATKKLQDVQYRMRYPMQVMNGLLREANITLGNSPAEYNRYQGAFAILYEQATNEKKRPLNEKEIKELGTPLIRETMNVPGSGWISDSMLRYRAMTPQSQAEIDRLPKDTVFIIPEGMPNAGKRARKN